HLTRFPYTTLFRSNASPVADSAMSTGSVSSPFDQLRPCRVRSLTSPKTTRSLAIAQARPAASSARPVHTPSTQREKAALRESHSRRASPSTSVHPPASASSRDHATLPPVRAARASSQNG